MCLLLRTGMVSLQFAYSSDRTVEDCLGSVEESLVKPRSASFLEKSTTETDWEFCKERVRVSESLYLATSQERNDHIAEYYKASDQTVDDFAY